MWLGSNVNASEAENRERGWLGVTSKELVRLSLTSQVLLACLASLSPTLGLQEHATCPGGLSILAKPALGKCCPWWWLRQRPGEGTDGERVLGIAQVSFPLLITCHVPDCEPLTPCLCQMHAPSPHCPMLSPACLPQKWRAEWFR